MSRILLFELYEGGSKTSYSYSVYLDESSDAEENSYYYDSATYTSQQLTGTNGFSAITSAINLGVMNNKCYRIRIMFASIMQYCSAWFRLSDDGYADYLTYYGSNGPNNGIYRIVVPCQYYTYRRCITGTTHIYGVSTINKTIPCTIYLFWGGGYLSGGTTHPSIIGTDTFDIGSTYSINVPSSVSPSNLGNTVIYYFFQYSYNFPNNPHSFLNSYGLDGGGRTIVYKSGSTFSYDIGFSPQDNVICTGQMAELVSYYGSEFTEDTQCPTSVVLNNYAFNTGNSGNALSPFDSVTKKYSVILNTVFLSNGPVNQMSYVFSGNSKGFVVETISFPNYASVSGCNWQAYMSGFLDTNYSTYDLSKSVTVTIYGYITSVSGWYYKVVAYDASVIKGTTALNSNNLSFTTTMEKLDGATVFFSTSPTITNTYWVAAKKATNSSYITTKNVFSWSTSTGGTSTTSLASIGEFDY